MKKTKKAVDDLDQTAKKNIVEMGKIWSIDIKELPDEIQEIDLLDFPDIVEKTKASLKVYLDMIKKEKKTDELEAEDLMEPMLDIFRYMILDMARVQINSQEGCKGMYA